MFFSLFQLRLNEGALVISRSGLAKMGVVLELEAVCGCGRDSLIGLHTLTLSCNQLQVRKAPGLLSRPSKSSRMDIVFAVSMCSKSIRRRYSKDNRVKEKNLVSGNVMTLDYATLT